MTEAAIDSILLFMKSIIGDLKNSLPTTYRQLRATVSDLIIPHRSYVLCPNGHDLYDSKIHTKCPRCNEESAGCKRFFYLPLIPRLRQMYEIPYLAKQLQKHLSNGLHHRGIITDLHQSKRWKDTYIEQSGEFHGDARSLMLCISSDGFQPFHHSTKNGTYSIWAFHTAVANLPGELREKFLLVNGLTEGKQSNNLVINYFKCMHRYNFICMCVHIYHGGIFIIPP